MFEEEYILSLLKNCNKNDNKIQYINRKYHRYGTDKLSLCEYNYIRLLNNLPELDIQKLRNCIYENMISYTDIENHTKISRTMMCMILRGTRNSTILQIKKILKYLSNLNINFEW